MTDYETDPAFRAWLATRVGGTGTVAAFARSVVQRGEIWRLRFDSSFHDEVSKAALAAARNEWLASRRRKPAPSSSRRGRRTVSLRTSSSGPGPKRRVRMKVRATPGMGPGTGQAVVSTLSLAYDIGYGFSEQILPGAFADSIAAHPTIPIYHQHDWDAGPIGTGRPTERGNQLLVDFELFLGQGDLVDRVYQAMTRNALDEWSIGFYAAEITVDQANPKCDQIAKGDLAEASVCVRGANPETGTLELASRAGWLMGTAAERKREIEVVKRATRQLVAAR